MKDLSKLESGVIKGDRYSLARAISLIESMKAEDRDLSLALLDRLTKFHHKARRLGFSGPPGAGKSTLLEAFGKHFLGKEENAKIGIFAVDPSSPLHGGALLGDRTRMPYLSSHERVFIRPSPHKGDGGGLMRRAGEILLLFEAAGYDPLFVESLGVGQGEYALRDYVDLFILLESPGGGDEITAMKSGISELADLICMTKIDGEDKALKIQNFYEKKRGFAARGRKVDFMMLSSLEGVGIAELYDMVAAKFFARSHAEKTALHEAQDFSWIKSSLGELFLEGVRLDTDPRLSSLLEKLARREISPPSLAKRWFSLLTKRGQD